MVAEGEVEFVGQTDTPQLCFPYKLLSCIHTKQLTGDADGVQRDEEGVPATTRIHITIINGFGSRGNLYNKTTLNVTKTCTKVKSVLRYKNGNNTTHIC